MVVPKMNYGGLKNMSRHGFLKFFILSVKFVMCLLNLGVRLLSFGNLK